MTDSTRLSARDAIIESGFRLLARNPSASLEDIANSAGVGRATLHRHFNGRDDLMETLALTALRELDEAAETAAEGAPSWTSAMKRILYALIPLGNRHSFIWREPIEHLPAIQTKMQKLAAKTSEMIEAAKKEGTFHDTVPTEWISQAYDNLIYAAWELVRSGEATPKQAAALAWTTLTHGLRDKIR